MWKPMASILAIVVAGCGSAGPAQLPINERPVSFVDSRSGALLSSVLLIPKYKATEARPTVHACWRSKEHKYEGRS
jgi:hypothetical protein